MSEMLSAQKLNSSEKNRAKRKAQLKGRKMNKAGRPIGTGVLQVELKNITARLNELVEMRKKTESSRAYLLISQEIWKIEARIRTLQLNRYYQFKEAA